MLNKIIFQGRFCENPELKQTQSGVSVSSFTLAVDRDFKNQSGERETDFILVVAWKSVAEFIVNHFSRGDMAIVSGRLQSRRWEDRDGNKRTAIEIVAENIYFCGPKKSQQEQNFNQLADAVDKFQEIEETESQGGLPF